jgi:hypothetical protein
VLLGRRCSVLLLLRRGSIVLLLGRRSVLLLWGCTVLLLGWSAILLLRRSAVLVRGWCTIVGRRLLSPLILLRSAIGCLLLTILLLWWWSAIVLLRWRSPPTTLLLLRWRHTVSSPLLGWRLLVIGAVVIEPGHVVCLSVSRVANMVIKWNDRVVGGRGVLIFLSDRSE